MLLPYAQQSGKVCAYKVNVHKKQLLFGAYTQEHTHKHKIEGNKN